MLHHVIAMIKAKSQKRQMNRESPVKHSSFLRKDVAQKYMYDMMHISSVLIYGTSNFKKTKEQNFISFAHFSKVLANTPYMYEISLYVYILVSDIKIWSYNNLLKIIKNHGRHERNTAQVASTERVSKKLNGQYTRFSPLRV